MKSENSVKFLKCDFIIVIMLFPTCQPNINTGLLNRLFSFVGFTNYFDLLLSPASCVLSGYTIK